MTFFTIEDTRERYEPMNTDRAATRIQRFFKRHVGTSSDDATFVVVDSDGRSHRFDALELYRHIERTENLTNPRTGRPFDASDLARLNRLVRADADRLRRVRRELADRVDTCLHTMRVVRSRSSAHDTCVRSHVYGQFLPSVRMILDDEINAPHRGRLLREVREQMRKGRKTMRRRKRRLDMLNVAIDDLV